MTPDFLIDPADPLPEQNAKLLKIAAALMRRVEQGSDGLGAAYAQFQRAVLLEEEVRDRTHDLARALELLNRSNAQLAEANRETEAARRNLTNAIETVQEGFALFSAEETLVMCNSRFGLHMPDIRERMMPGLSFRAYVELVSQSQFLDLASGETAQAWAERRLARHQDRHVMFNVRMVWNRWVQVSEHRTPDGGTVILQTDVTDIMRLERRERERMLDTQARLIRATLDHLDQGVCIFDDQARMVGWNQRLAELLGLPLTRLRMGTGFALLLQRFAEADAICGVDATRIDAWVGETAKRAPLSFELQRLNGRTLTAFAQEMPDRGFVISFTDVSAERAAIRAAYDANEQLEKRVIERTLELEDALAEAERANASKSRFVAAASHDVLQPLSAAKLYLGLVLADPPDAQTRSVLERANNALCSVEDILGALLDISKLDAGPAAVHIGPVHLGRMLAQLQDELAPLAQRTGLQLRVVASNVSVLSDASYLRRILQNLMANAVRYTERGKVLVGVRRHRGRLRLEVHDTGPGIAEDQQELVFREFHRVSGQSSASEGLGLGLAIVERACALLHHPLHLRTRPGVGSCFAIELPLTTPRRETAKPVRSLEQMIVLLIARDSPWQQQLCALLEDWRVSVLAAPDLAAAEQLLREFDELPDAVLLEDCPEHGSAGDAVLPALWQRNGQLPSCLVAATPCPRAESAANRVELQRFATQAPASALHYFLLQHCHSATHG